jgi:hypothetical protein
LTLACALTDERNQALKRLTKRRSSKMEDRTQEDESKDDINIQVAALTDLPVAEEQADETKGGATKSTPKLFLHCATGQHKS